MAEAAKPKSKAASRGGILPRKVPRVLPYQGAMTFRPHGDVVGRYGAERSILGDRRGEDTIHRVFRVSA
jgi:hypothetical protein